MSTMHVRLKIENGVLKPVDPATLPFAEGDEIEVEIVAPPDSPEAVRAKLERQRAAIAEISGLLKDNGPTDWSARHDEILYRLARPDE